MNRDWIAQELRTADLNDERLNRRFAEVLRSLSQRPNVSIPIACGGYAETMAAYRFFENEKTTLEKILQPHSQCDLCHGGDCDEDAFRSRQIGGRSSCTRKT